MSNDEDDLISPEEQLRFLQKAYQQNLPEKIQVLKDTWTASSRGKDTVMLKNLNLALHNLTGSSATFGYHEISTIAHHLELIVSSLIVSQAPPDGLLAHTIEDAFEKLENVLNQILSHPVILSPEKSVPVRKKEYREIYILSSASENVDVYTKGIDAHGYHVTVFTSITTFLEAMSVSLPGACILSLNAELTLDQLADEQYRTSVFCQTKSIVLSFEDSFEQRMQCVRAGSDLFMVKPAPVHALCLCLDIATGIHLVDNQYRVLIVENDPEQALFFAMILQMAGMHASILFNPLKILGPMEHFKPELVLMSLYFDDCSGIELASVLRQCPRLVSTPILFLSNGNNESQQFDAASFGADDLLTKPIKVERLISSVEQHIKRYRVLNTFFTYNG